MRLSQVIVHISADDINQSIQELTSDAKIQIVRIDADGVHGQVRLLIWHIDFVARPSITSDGQISIDVAAQKLVPIPPAIVERQLRVAIKDAPAGVDVIQQALRMHLPSLLRPFGVSLAIRELRTLDGYIRIALEGVEFPAPRPKPANALTHVGDSAGDQ